MKITPRNSEKQFDKKLLLVTKTDLRGIITYANKEFMHTVGMSERELIGKPHNIIRHPDMPRIIFKMLWSYLQAGKEIHAYVKNLCADGSYYWVFANVTPSYYNSKVVGYHSARRAPKEGFLSVIAPLYTELLAAERSGGIEASQRVLNDLLQSKGMEYDEFILSF